MYIFLQQYWWLVVSLLGAILVFLLFVQGGNSLLFCLGKTEEHRKMMVNSTGRKWEFTFTTLVTFGGAFFASFPLFYSTSFGGAYWLWMIILFSFVLQAVSYEFQSKAGNLLGKKTYRTFLVINGVVGPVLLGGAVATFFTGSDFYINKANMTDMHNERKRELMEKCFECYAENGLTGTGIKALADACGDVNMIDKFILDFRGALTFASANSEGQGLKMAEKIGAASTHMNFAAVYGYGVPMSKDKNNRKGWIFRGHVMNLYGSITLNKEGRRFINDDQNSTKVAQFLASHQERTVYQLATEAQLSDFMQNDPIQVIGWDRTKFNQEKEEGGHFINKVNSLEECASEMGCSFDTLKNTIDVYNRSVASGNDEEFGRRFMKGQFLSGPFYLFKCTPVVGITIGGLKVNQRMQVLNEYGEPISKLFAAGEIVGGLHGTSYIGGCSLAGALALGRMVGEQLAKNQAAP